MTDPLKNRLALNAIGFSSNAGRWRTEAMRSHASPRLIFFYKGQGRITVAGLTAGYGPNNLIFLPAHTMYGFDAGPTTFGQMLTIPQAMASDWPEEHTHLRLRDVHAQKEIALHFDNLERELASDKTGHSRAAHHYLGIMSVFVQRQLELRSPEMVDARSDSSAARLVAAYTDLVERDYATGRGVADYARSLGVTPTHLTRCCNQTCGRSALALLNDRILYEARLLLRDTHQPIKDISAKLGFTSAAYFSRSFQSQTGTSPSGFRKTGKGSAQAAH
jgi:AraC family transcriptional regulator, transcriptional activator of pobA